MGFQQATIPIEKKREFEQLRTAIDQVYSPPLVEKFLGDLKGHGVNVRQFDRLLVEGLIEKHFPEVGSAKTVYETLTLSDQAQLREFYLERLEQVAPELRKKFSGIYRTF